MSEYGTGFFGALGALQGYQHPYQPYTLSQQGPPPRRDLKDALAERQRILSARQTTLNEDQTELDELVGLVEAHPQAVRLIDLARKLGVL